MGNTVAYESQGAGYESEGRATDIDCHRSNSERKKRNCDLTSNILQRKSSPYLVEPIVDKLTERGHATLSMGAGKNAENEREGHGADNNNIDKLRYAVSEMQGWRSHMEDKYILNPKLCTSKRQEQLLKDHHLFAVFDGHGGDFTSSFCGEHFVPTLIAQKDWKRYLKLPSEVPNKSSGPTQESVIGLQLLKSALTATFHKLDTKLLTAQRKRRLSQLCQLEDLVYPLVGDVEYDVFQPGTDDHKSVMNFSKELPRSMRDNVPLERSGCTGVVVLITPSHTLCANAGDSRAILSKKSDEKSSGVVLPLSFDHKPNKDVERCRVEKDGGFVKTKRVDGGLAVSRCFGDFEFKNCGRDDDNAADSPRDAKTKNRLPKDHRVTVHPDIIVHAREPNNDEFLVLACDGIWDRLTNRDCADLVSSLAYGESESDVGLICEEVIDTALELDSRDNMTCCVVFFPAAKIGSHNGVLKRRTNRSKSRGRNSTPAKRAQLRQHEKCEKEEKGESCNHPWVKEGLCLGPKVEKQQGHRAEEKRGWDLNQDHPPKRARNIRPEIHLFEIHQEIVADSEVVKV
eukprot:CAMPEP_0201632388 /NCGR_PEP_ID=MMETSP0493-20130528/6041_1 /ASSEMBLY_ACC=CAM_ASM_000838 /TAXON_ID=420259 /ORGANISM="Thalassiosira gravida, Strain GMp14c1" /LENGTH=570 /DNA_ID=CAMNT_0048103905 /DNA_START=126 /DNA_END=1839 /DNA_ORIENTATION=+